MDSPFFLHGKSASLRPWRAASPGTADLRNTWAKRADVWQVSNGWSRRATGISILFGKQRNSKATMRFSNFPCGTAIWFDPPPQVFLRKSQREVSPLCGIARVFVHLDHATKCDRRELAGRGSANSSTA